MKHQLAHYILALFLLFFGAAPVQAQLTPGAIISQAAGTNGAGIDTDAEKKAFREAIGIRTEAIVVVGDSLSSTGSGDASTSWAAYYSRQGNNNAANYYNYAVAGRTAAQIDAAYASDAHLVSPAVKGGVGILYDWSGTNDLNTGATDTAVIASRRSIWAKAKADGYKVAAFTITRSGLLTAGKEISRQNVNTAVRSELGTNIDYLIDADLYLPNHSDTTYFLGDNLHLNANGGIFLSKQAEQAVNGGNVFRSHLVWAKDTGSASIPNTGTLTKVPYTTAIVDRAALFSNGTITIKEAGWYRVDFKLAVISGNSTTRWYAELYKNGSPYERLIDITSLIYTISGGTIVDCAAGDTLEIYVSQNYSGGAINTTGGTPRSTFSAFKINSYP